MAHKQPISNSGGQSFLETDSESATFESSDFPSIRKKYSCEYCSKSFSRSGHLSMHHRTHTGERPFVCQYCSRAFTQSSALYRHHKTCAKSPNKGKPEPLSKTTSVHQVSSTASKQKEMDSPISSHSFSAPTIYGGFFDKDIASDNDDDDIDDDIMFVCCDHTFTSSADYDKHVRSQHSKSQPDSFIPHCSTERDTVLSTASNKLLLNSHIDNKADFNLYPTYGPGSEHVNDIGSIHNTQDGGQEPGIIYLLNTSSDPDTVTINLSDHSVSNSCSSNSRNASFLDDRSNSGIKLVASKPTVPSSDFINDYDYSEKQQINKFVSSMKPDLKPASRFSQSVLGVPHKSPHSETNHINSLSNGLLKTPAFASIKTEASNPLKTSMESVVNSKEVKSSCIPTFSSHGRLKTSRLQSCQFCPRQFTRTSHLTQHLRTHTGERPFQCEYCGNAFTQTSALNRHLKTCHVAQSVNSNVAGNATFQPQPLSSLPISSDFEASHEICYPYQDCEVVFPQPVPVDSYRKDMHADGINPEITIQTSSSSPMHMPLSYESDSSDSYSTSKVHFSAYSKSHIPKSKSCLAKMKERSIENQVLQSKRKPLFQKIVKSNKKFCCDVCSIEFLSRQHLMLHMRKHLQPNSTSLKTTAQSQSRNHLPSSLVWAPSSRNKNLFRNKVYNTFNHKRTFEKHKSMSFASNAHPSITLARPKTNSFFKKHPRFVSSSEESKLKDLSKKKKTLSKSLQARNLKNHSEEFIVTLNSSEESTKDSVLSDRSESPKNLLYPSDSSFQRASKISTTVYTCDICTKSFYSDLLFRIHRSTHSLEKKKKKNSLTTSAKNRDPAGFNPTPTLETAPSTSSDQMRKTFPCVYCHKTFLRHSHLETHVRTHTGEKPFQCESCGRAFSQSSARNRHIKTCFMAKQILNTGLLTAESLTSINLSQSTATVINALRNLDDSSSDVTLLNYDQPRSTSNAVQAHNPNESPSKYPMPSKETCVRVTPLDLHLKLPNSEEVKGYESGDSYSHQTTNQSSVNPIKDRKVIGNELKISKPEQECRNEGSGPTECLQIIRRSEQQNPSFVEKNDDETNDLETMIFDSALQVVHESLQMKSENSLTNDCLTTKKESATSQAMLGSPEGVSGQNCPDPSDICPSPLDIPQPNVTLSLGSEFVDLMDTDLPNISHTMSTRQEEETSPSSVQKDVYPDYSPETPPPFVSECLSPKDAGTAKPLAELIEVSSSSSSSSSSSVCGVILRNINSGGIDKSYPCNYCGEIFSNSDLLNNHEKSHTAVKFFCFSCSDGFTDASALGKHLQICVAARKESSKEPVSVTDICLSQGLQMPKIDENINEKRESAKASELGECQSSSSSSSLFNARQTNVDQGNNLEKKTLKNWPLKLFSDEGTVISSELKDSISDSGNAKSTFDHSSGKTYNIKSSKDSIEGRSSDDHGAVGMETDCQTSARKLTCPYCDLDFSSPNQLDEHVSCHVSEKPYICWFCKESYVLSSDFEQHLKICGAPATFPNLSSPNSSKGESNNEDDDNNSKFTDVALFTPITVTANLSDCDDDDGDDDDERGGGGGGNETDVPLAWNHSKDKINSLKLPTYQIQDPGTSSQSKNLQEKGQDFAETFKSVEIFSTQLQINNPNQLVSIPDTSREFSLGSGSSAKDSMVENLTYPGENMKQSPKDNTNLNESPKKEVQDTNDKCSMADSTPEEITKELRVYEYPKSLSSEFLESQEALKDEPSESIVFLCCHQTYTSAQDYNEHLLNSHADPTDNKSEELREKQVPQPSKISKAEALNGCQDRSSQNKRLLINNDPLTLNRYVCQFCTRGFSRSGHLIQHMRTHTGERPYPCQFCSKAFTQSSALNRHWKTCPKAKLFYNDGVKRTSAGYCVTLPGFQKSSEGNGKSRSRNISPLPVQLFENQTRNKSFSAGNNLLNSSPFGNIDEISCDKANDGITKCEHCGLKFLKLNDFIQHSNTCSSADKISLMDGTFHQEFQSLGTRDQDKRSNQIPKNCLQPITIKECKNEDEQFSNIEIKKEALDVVFECDFCHKLFSDEYEMVRHQESECLQNEPLNWNLAENLENRETTNTIKPEEIFPFTCCEEMFFDLKTYHIHRETHHSLKEHQNYNALCQGDDQTKQRLNSNVKTEVDLQNQICYDIYLNSKSYSDSSPEIRQLSSVPKGKLDNTVEKRVSDEHSELPSVDRSTGLDNISRFQVLESSNSVSESQALISANDKKNYGIDSDGVISPSQETQKSSAKDITQGHDTTLNWLQWENYISQQLNISNPNRTAVVVSQEKKYACDYCDKKFTRSGHLVMHRRTHTGERPFSCSHCHKAFTQSSALNRHLKTCNLARLASTSHLETKSPASELICCGINFHWAGALNVHLVTHNIYKCHICNQDFENFDLLLIHIKSHASQEQTPVSNSQGQSIDNHCDFCLVSFQSVVEQLIHMKTEHWTKSSEKLTSNNQVSSNPDNIPKLSCLSSKTEYSKPDNSSENSNGSSTKNSLESSSSFILNQPKPNFLSRTKIGKISRVRRLSQSTSLRIPSKQSIYSKYQQNKQYPSSTSLKRRPSTFLSEPKSVRSLEFSTPNTSMRSILNHNLRRAIKRAVNNSSKPHTLPEQYTSLFGTLSPTKAKDQQSAIFDSTDIPLSQTDSSNNILARILLNNHSNRKLMVKREKNDSHVYPNKTQSANSQAECDKDDNCYDEGQFNNNSDGSSYEAISSVINTFQLDKSNSQTKQHLLHSDVSCLPNLKIQPSNLIALKRSLLNSGNLKSTTEVNVTAGKAEQLLLKTIKYQKEPNLFVSIDSSSSSDFVCPLCQKSFTCSSHLNSHIQTHTEEWPYVCIQCNRCFQRENALERHLKNCAVGNSKTLVQPSCSVVSNSRINEFFTDASSTDKKITFVSAAIDEQNLAETIFESQQNHVDVTKNGAITPDVRNRALSASFSPGKSDNELSIASKVQSGRFNLRNSQQPNKIGETISLSKVSPCTDTKDDDNKKEYKESVMAATEPNTNPSQVQEVQCQSNKSFLKTNGSKRNPPQTLCSPQQTLHSSGFDRYIVKIEPGSEDVKSYDALSEMSDLKNCFNVSTIGKLSDTSKEKLKNYSHNDKSLQPDDQSDPTLCDSANKPKTKGPGSTLESFDQSGVSLSQNGTRTLEDSACTTSVVPKKKKKNSHVCRKCGQIFPQFFDLFQHNCPRSAERYSFTCEYCDKSFSRHSHLITHRRTHTGERPYQCCYCQRSFTQTSALNRHQKTCSFIPAHLKTKTIKTTLIGSSNSL